MKIKILIPIYNDWQSVLRLLDNINSNLEIISLDAYTEVLLDDSVPNYGLAACIHTDNLNRAINLSKQVDSGMIWINHWGYPDEFSHPAGGFKNSGIGKDMGSSGISEYYKEKAIWIPH